MIKVLQSDNHRVLLDIDGKEMLILQKQDNNPSGSISLSMSDGYMYVLPNGSNGITLTITDKRI